MIPWPAAHQAPLFMAFSRQAYWSRLPFPSPGDLPNPGIKPGFPALQADSLLTELQGKPRTWKQPRCPLTDEWIKKLWYIYTMEYYSAIKRNVFESVLMRWMNLEPIMQSEVSQKDKYRILTHTQNLEECYWRTYFQGSNGEIDIENRLLDMGRGQERVRCME